MGKLLLAKSSIRCHKWGTYLLRTSRCRNWRNIANSISAHKSLPNLPDVEINLVNVIVVAWSKCWEVYANNSWIKIGNTLICKGWTPLLLLLGAIEISCGTATQLDMNYINRSTRTRRQPYFTIIALQSVHLSNLTGQACELIFHINHRIYETGKNHSEMEMLDCARNEQNTAPFDNVKRANITKNSALSWYSWSGNISRGWSMYPRQIKWEVNSSTLKSSMQKKWQKSPYLSELDSSCVVSFRKWFQAWGTECTSRTSGHFQSVKWQLNQCLRR